MPDIGQKAIALLTNGFTVGQRDSRVNRNYEGKFMVLDEYEDKELPTNDGSNGPWCVVGDDLETLINQAFDFMLSTRL